jgi:hypothetical protein
MSGHHSPLPWTARSSVTIDDARGRLIGGTVKSGWIDSNERMENLALILRAVNNHERLVAALQDIATGGESWTDCARKARATLAQVRR